MGVRDLKAFLSERGVSMLGVTEKAELVALARAAVAHTAKAADEVPLLIWDTMSHWSDTTPRGMLSRFALCTLR